MVFSRIIAPIKARFLTCKELPRSGSTSLEPLAGVKTSDSLAVQQLTQETASPRTACALLSALVLHFDGPARTRQLARIAWYGDEALMAEILRLEPRVVPLSPEERLSLMPSAIRGLSGLHSQRRQRFMANLRSLINADEAVSLFEYTLLLAVESALEPPTSDPRPLPANPDEVGEQIATLIAILARALSRDESAARRAYEPAMKLLTLAHRAFPPYRASFERLSWAMRGLRRISPLLAEQILSACDVVVAHNTPPHTPPSAEHISLLRALGGCFLQDSATPLPDRTSQTETVSVQL